MLDVASVLQIPLQQSACQRHSSSPRRHAGVSASDSVSPSAVGDAVVSLGASDDVDRVEDNDVSSEGVGESVVSSGAVGVGDSVVS